MDKNISRQNLEYLRQFVNTALERGWHPTNERVEDSHIILDPPSVRLSVASPNKLIDLDIYVDWLAPLYEIQLVKAVWGEKLVASNQPIPEYRVAWRYHQHKLLDLFQTAGLDAYFEYLDVAV